MVKYNLNIPCSQPPRYCPTTPSAGPNTPSGSSTRPFPLISAPHHAAPLSPCYAYDPLHPSPPSPPCPAPPCQLQLITRPLRRVSLIQLALLQLQPYSPTEEREGPHPST
ncbi:hypothetical protein BCR35DRAFT_32469 [Leucosporidium creatinivorum]|uniref:Uncharacterized protein n=1 Tax=Leucosporidium creatinivorum TaxID=106004 RepID=A0A1Y2FXU4_9BASI|nr:hypothetical protein BCR35DRAFT_32469 [Leucosporidium creatinivorum]